LGSGEKQTRIGVAEIGGVIITEPASIGSINHERSVCTGIDEYTKLISSIFEKNIDIRLGPGDITNAVSHQIRSVCCPARFHFYHVGIWINITPDSDFAVQGSASDILSE